MRVLIAIATLLPTSWASAEEINLKLTRHCIIASSTLIRGETVDRIFLKKNEKGEASLRTVGFFDGVPETFSRVLIDFVSLDRSAERSYSMPQELGKRVTERSTVSVDVKTAMKTVVIERRTRALGIDKGWRQEFKVTFQGQDLFIEQNHSNIIGFSPVLTDQKGRSIDHLRCSFTVLTILTADNGEAVATPGLDWHCNEMQVRSPKVDSMVRLPPMLAIALATASRPTPRPGTSVTTFAVLNPGINILANPISN